MADKSTNSSEVRPPAVQRAEPAVRKFPCPSCNAKLDFDPSERAMKCPYCGHMEEISKTQDFGERDYEEYLNHRSDFDRTIQGRSEEIRCPGCGAIVLLEDKVVTDNCPYCATHLENVPETAKAMIPPESLLPFRLEPKKARVEFEKWLSSRWFAPRGFRKLADLGRFSGIYVPFWTYDAMTFTTYSGLRGDNYPVTQTVMYTDEEGNPRTRTITVIETRWTPVRSEVRHFFDDILICGSKSMPRQMVDELVPWDMDELEGFQPNFLSGFKTERYAIGLEEGFQLARKEMEPTIMELIRRDIGGDFQQIESYKTRHKGITFKHILLPVWLASYRYHNKLFQILVNARTGEVVGKRPYSSWKIGFFTLAICLAVGAIIAFLMRGR